MADRSLRFVLLGEDRSASKVITGVGRNASSTAGTFAKLGITAGRAFTAIGAVAAASTVKLGIAYQDSLNTFEAVSDASIAQMEAVRAKSSELGADLSLPATSAAGAALAMTELAKAGLDVDQSMAAAKGTLQLAAAAQTDEANAAMITANALNAFNLEADQATRVADLLAASSNASSAEIGDMALALSQSSAVAAAAGISIEELSAALAMMANRGIKGSDAGTSFKSMLLALQGPSEKAAGTLSDLGISIYDAQGAMLPMRDIVGVFTDKMAGLNQEQRESALATVFGSDAVRTANTVLLQGVEAYDKSTVAVSRNGAAAELAAAKTQGLGGTLRGLQSQLETVAIQAFDRFAPALEDGVGSIGSVLVPALSTTVDVLGATAEGIGSVINFLDENNELVILAAGLWVSRYLPAIQFVTAASMRLVAVNVATWLTSIKGAAGGVRDLASTPTAGVLAVATALTAVGRTIQEFRDASSDAKSDLAELTDGFDPHKPDTWAMSMNKASRALEEAQKNLDGQAGVRHGNWLDDVKGAWSELAGQLPGVNSDFAESKATVDAAADAQRRMAEEQEKVARNAERLTRVIPLTSDEIRDLASRAGVDLSGSLSDVTLELMRFYEQSVTGAPGTEALAGAVDTLGDSAATAEDKVESLKTILDQLLGKNLDVEQATLRYEEALDKLSEGVKENGNTLDADTEKGRANREALVAGTKSIADQITALSQQGQSYEQLLPVYEQSVDRLRETARQAGLSDEQVGELLTTYGLTPDLLQTLIRQQGAEAVVQQAQTAAQALLSIPTSVVSQVRTEYREVFLSELSRDAAAARRGTVTATPSSQLTGFGERQAGRRASGGPMLSGAWYEVGEQGPELVKLDGKGTAMSASASQRALSGAGGGAPDPAAAAVRDQTATQRGDMREVRRLLERLVRASEQTPAPSGRGRRDALVGLPR